ncbi:hypothetical protein L6R29_25435 [Myxococcota bacterium]|nr:hypothetical protein [Myxococcota bacterium]
MSPHYPSLYQINTRVWLRRFDTPSQRATLRDIPPAYWDALASKGIDIVWLMGVWETVESTIPAYCLTEDLQQAYRAALPDWRIEDVIGSPYAVGRYRVSEKLGGNASLSAVRTQLHQRRMRLVLDFVPNHFSAHSPIIAEHPAIFLQGSPAQLQQSPEIFYRPPHTPEKIIAHGRDPYFAPWQDTAQIDYSLPAAQQHMISELSAISELCDGVRCDMAMLCLRSVFDQTWKAHRPPQHTGSQHTEPHHTEPHHTEPQHTETHHTETQQTNHREFWSDAIAEIRKKHPRFLFLAEVYWGLAPTLQHLGFDATYDKDLLDALKHEDSGRLADLIAQPITQHARAIRFLENHDEARAQAAFPPPRAQVSALITYTLPSIRFFHDGQWEGKRTHLPVQLGREPDERPNPQVSAFYDQLLSLLNAPIYRNGRWHLTSLKPPAPNSDHHQDLLAWLWSHHEQRRLVVINPTPHTRSGRIFLPSWGHRTPFALEDTLHAVSYLRDPHTLDQEGLYIFLQPRQAHLFAWSAVL